MSSRVQYVETITIPSSPSSQGYLIPLAGVAAVPYVVDDQGNEGGQANAYAGRSGATAAPTLNTDTTGTISFWLDPGDYNIHVSDQQSPKRLADYIRGFTAPIIDTNQLIVAAQNLIQFTGDTKFSLQTADHGLKADGSFEWLLMTSDIDGGGRKVDHTIYSTLWALLGSPAPDSAGMFRLPNVSGRTLVAAGAALGLTVRHLLDIFGAETHVLAANEQTPHAHAGSTVTVHDNGHFHSISGAMAASSRASAATTSPGDALGSLNAAGNSGQGTAALTSTLTIANSFGNAGGTTDAHSNTQPSIVLNLFAKS